MTDKNLLVMLIEDDQEDVMLFEEAISEISPKIELFSFSNWNKANEFLEATEKIPDIIFIDYLLPGKSGKDFANELRDKKPLVNTPIILLSGMAKHVEKDCLSVNEVISKPSNYNQLLESIRRIVNVFVPQVKL
jgi:response regulator RpfG family c-di-GMP phosphodiesterase